MGDSIMSSIIRATTTSGLQIAPDNSGSLQLQTNGSTTALTIDTSQNVGIGVTSSGAKLNVFRADSVLTGLFSGTTKGARIGTNSTYSFIEGVDTTGSVSYQPFMIGGSEVRFTTSDTERMRIDSSGEVYIAGTTDRGAFNLQCNGTGVWGAGAYTNGSDERIKENITTLDSGLDVVAKLNPVTYTYKEDWSRDQSIQTGFIAQDLLVALEGKNYVDGIVNQSSEYMSVAYQNIIPILTKAIQEQQTIINDLKARVETLEAK
jgi:hypothetical protein